MPRLILSLAIICPICTLAPADERAKPAKPIVINGELNAKDAKDSKLKGSPAKAHKVNLTRGTVYVVDLTSKDFDAFLRLEDARGEPLAEDDDGGGGWNARLFFIPPATAEYTLIATSHDGKSGKYRLTVQESQLPTPLKLERGAATVDGKLAVNGPRSPFSPHASCKIFRIDLNAGTTYVIDLASSAFDAYLAIGDPSLRLLASDDDSGGKRNARIRFACKADGAYYLVASGLGQPEGAFTLKVAAAQ